MKPDSADSFPYLFNPDCPLGGIILINHRLYLMTTIIKTSVITIGYDF